MQGFRGVSDLGFGTLDNFFFRWGEVLHENVYRAFLDVLDGPQRPGTIMMIMNNC